MAEYRLPKDFYFTNYCSRHHFPSGQKIPKAYFLMPYDAC